MNVKRILISVVWEHVVIMMMEHSMNVNVKMVLWPLDPVEMSRVLVRSCDNVFLSLFLLSKILMSVKRILISVVWGHVVIMMMERSMRVNVKMEL